MEDSGLFVDLNYDQERWSLQSKRRVDGYEIEGHEILISTLDGVEAHTVEDGVPSESVTEFLSNGEDEIRFLGPKVFATLKGPSGEALSSASIQVGEHGQPHVLFGVTSLTELIPDRDRLYVGRQESDSLKILDLESGETFLVPNITEGEQVKVIVGAERLLILVEVSTSFNRTLKKEVTNYSIKGKDFDGNDGWVCNLDQAPSAIAVSEGAAFLAIAGPGGLAINERNSKILTRLKPERSFRSVWLSPDSRYIVATGGRTVHCWEADTHRSLAVIESRHALRDARLLSGRWLTALNSKQQIVAWPLGTDGLVAQATERLDALIDKVKVKKILTNDGRFSPDDVRQMLGE